MGYMLQNANYFRNHPFTLHGDEFDYVSVIFAYGWGIRIPGLTSIAPGIQGAITKDCFGRWYVSYGETGGISLLPASIGIVGGRVINGDRENLSNTLENFIPGKSSNLTVSIGGCIGESKR